MNSYPPDFFSGEGSLDRLCPE